MAEENARVLIAGIYSRDQLFKALVMEGSKEGMVFNIRDLQVFGAYHGYVYETVGQEPDAYKATFGEFVDRFWLPNSDLPALKTRKARMDALVTGISRIERCTGKFLFHREYTSGEVVPLEGGAIREQPVKRNPARFTMDGDTIARWAQLMKLFMSLPDKFADPQDHLHFIDHFYQRTSLEFDLAGALATHRDDKARVAIQTAERLVEDRMAAKQRQKGTGLQKLAAAQVDVDSEPNPEFPDSSPSTRPGRALFAGKPVGLKRARKSKTSG